MLINLCQFHYLLSAWRHLFVTWRIACQHCLNLFASHNQPTSSSSRLDVLHFLLWIHFHNHFSAFFLSLDQFILPYSADFRTQNLRILFTFCSPSSSSSSSSSFFFSSYSFFFSDCHRITSSFDAEQFVLAPAFEFKNSSIGTFHPDFYFWFFLILFFQVLPWLPPLLPAFTFQVVRLKKSVRFVALPAILRLCQHGRCRDQNKQDCPQTMKTTKRWLLSFLFTSDLVSIEQILLIPPDGKGLNCSLHHNIFVHNCKKAAN